MSSAELIQEIRYSDGRERVSQLCVAQEAALVQHWVVNGAPSHLLPNSIVRLGLSLNGPLDVGRVKFAFTEMVRRHEILRTAVGVTREIDDQERCRIRDAARNEGRYFGYGLYGLKVAERAPVSIVVRDVGVRGRWTGSDDDIVAECSEEVSRPFVQDELPFLRVILLRIHRTQHLLIVVLPHHVADFWSTRQIVRHELEAFYDSSFCDGRETLEPLPYQFGQFAAWRNEHFSGERLAALGEFWRRQWQRYGDATVRPAALVRAKPASTPSLESTVITRALGHQTAMTWKQFLVERRVTKYVTGLAAMYLLLAARTGAERVSMWTTTAGRGVPGAELLIGSFGNRRLIGVDVMRDASVASFLQSVQEACVEADVNDVPMAIRYTVVPAEVAMQTRGPQVVFDCYDARQGQVAQTLADGLSVDSAVLPQLVQRVVGVEFEVLDFGSNVEARLRFGAHVCDAAEATQLLNHYCRLLIGLLELDATSVQALMDRADG